MKNYLSTSINPFYDLLFPFERSTSHYDMMATDAIEYDEYYEMKVNLPNIKKENIKISVNHGYLTINASYKENEDRKGKYIFRESYQGEYERSYYVGENVKLSDLSASLEDGILSLRINKPEEVKEEEKYLRIS